MAAWRSPGARRLRPVAVVLPILLVVALQVIRNLVLAPLLGAAAAADIVGGATVAGVLAFSIVIWRLAERAEAGITAAYLAARRGEHQLIAMHEAALTMTAALDLPTVLRRVVEGSRAVIGSRYGAVAVLGPDGAIAAFVTSGLDDATLAALGPPPAGHGLLGLVIESKQALRVDDIGAHEESVGFPPGHPPMRRLLAIPLWYRGVVTGSLYLADREDGQPFDAGDQETLERFGAQAAIAIGNARLYWENQRLSLIEERERISMDLHDGVLQTLYAVGLGLEAVSEDIETDPAGARRGTAQAVDRLLATIADIRHYIFDLRAAQEDAPGSLRLHLQQLLDALPAHPGVEVSFAARGPVAPVPRAAAWGCWHIVREATSNALRHSGCRRVTISLDSGNGALTLTIADDGRGFVPEAALDDSHQGLGNMRRRARALGGTLELTSAPGLGTTVILRLPGSGAQGDGTA